MVFPSAPRGWPLTRRQLVKAAALSIHERAGRSIRTLIHRVGRAVKILVGRADLDVLEDCLAGVGGDGGRIDDLQVTADGCAIDDPKFEIAELQRRASQTGGRG